MYLEVVVMGSYSLESLSFFHETVQVANHGGHIPLLQRIHASCIIGFADISDEDISEEEQESIRENKMNLDSSLGAYPYDKWVLTL